VFVKQQHSCKVFFKSLKVRIKSDHLFYQSKLNQFSKVSPEMSTSWLDLSAYTYLFHANMGELRASHLVTILYRAAICDSGILRQFSSDSKSQTITNEADRGGSCTWKEG
jgi:hypothetical protein